MLTPRGVVLEAFRISYLYIDIVIVSHGIIICSSAGSRADGTTQDEPLKVADNTDGHETAPKTQLGGVNN